jgi:hypothetical protein
MDRSTIRAFAAGILLATAIIGSIYYYSKPKELTEKQIHSYLQKKGLIAVKIKEYELLKQSTQNLQPTPPTAQPKKDTASKPITVHAYRLVIDKGKVPADIAEELEEAQVIKDAKAFTKYLEDRDLTRKIRIGTYNVNSGMNYAELSRIITSGQ